MLAENGASVKDIFHERAWLHSSVDQVVIKAVLETRGAEHNEQLLEKLVAVYPDASLGMVDSDFESKAAFKI